MSYILNSSDGENLYHPKQSDLISNLSLFNQEYNSKRLSELEDFSDNSDYSTYPTFDDVLAEYDPDTYDGKTFTVRVDEKHIYSSDSELNGFDRPSWLRNKSNDDKCRENLRKLLNGNKRGWHEPDANTLNGWIRVEEVVTGDIDSTLGVSETKYEFTLVKNMGNHRFWMKKIANKGGICEYLMKIQFHTLSTISNPIAISDYICIEGDGHDADADARASQNEKQKFVSAYRSGKEDVVNCFNFLKKLKVEFHITKDGHGIMQQEGFNVNGDWPVIHSIQGLRDGLSNGMFKKYGEDNVKAAIGTCSVLCKKTKEDGFSYSAVSVLALMYRSLTDDHTNPSDTRKQGPLFTKPDLEKFFIELYEMRNSSLATSFGTPKFSKMADLSQSQGMKSWPYIASVAFWPEIQNWYKDKINNGNGVLGFSDGNPCMLYFINKADTFVRGDVKKNVS